MARVGLDYDNIRHIPLLKEEDARYAANTGICSANYYQGDIKTAHRDLKSRLREVLRANPWIGGVVKPLSKLPKSTRRQITTDPALRGKIGKSALVFPTTIAEQQLDDEVDSLLILEDEVDPQLRRGTAYGTLAAACQNASRVVPNRSGLYKSGRSVLRISMVPISDEEFCVVVGLSHLIADGDTYFRIMTMLSTKRAEQGQDGDFLFNVDKLDPNRQYLYRTLERTAVGMDEWKFMSSPVFIKMMIQGLMTKPKKDSSAPAQSGYQEPSGIRIRAHLIDEGKVTKQKQQYQDQLNGSIDPVTDMFSKTDGVHFISTQDIITTSFLNATASRLPMFTFNLRERCPELSKNLAGNYETSMLLDPDSYASAPSVRQSLLPTKGCFRRPNPMPLPGFCGKTSSAFMTTWCFRVEGRAAGLYLEGCKQLLHLPIMPVSILKLCPMDFAVVFNANIDISENGKRAILMFCKEATDQDLMSSSNSVLGKVVDADTFYDPEMVEQR